MPENVETRVKLSVTIMFPEAKGQLWYDRSMMSADEIIL